MRYTAILRAAAYSRTPMIKFIGRHSIPASIDHTPRPHPASPTQSLPDHFTSSSAQRHESGQSNSSSPIASALAYGPIASHSGAELGPVEPKKGEFFDRSELPARFHKTPWTEEEIEAVTSGGASLFG